LKDPAISSVANQAVLPTDPHLLRPDSARCWAPEIFKADYLLGLTDKVRRGDGRLAGRVAFWLKNSQQSVSGTPSKPGKICMLLLFHGPYIWHRTSENSFILGESALC
jgi:hypothetical protein